MFEYRMITFVKMFHWEVFGLVNEYRNVSLGSYTTKQEAMDKAHSYALPVMQGHTNSYDVAATLRKLA